MNFWQVSAGQGTRNYSDIFLKFGIMLIGRSSASFSKGAKVGDVVILKRPHHKAWRIVAAGHITGEYEQLEQFEDVEGWNIQHCRKVEWVCPPMDEEQPARRKAIDMKGLAMGTFIRVNQKDPIDRAMQLLGEGEKQESEEIPPPANRISDEYLVESLIANWLRPADAETVIQAIRHVRRLASWYARYGRELSEHEIRTFLIVPVLLALGWSEQKIKIEWNYTDISLFHEVFKKGAEPDVILESKRLSAGLGYAERQLKRYADEHPSCHILVASNGTRYQLYDKKDDCKWNLKKHLDAYLNLLNLKDRHPYLTNVGGAPDLFKSLMPR
ncbi:MAG: hypothetical protein O2783_05265 [Chloroflexi bacterium]|nr:hypothetical protein [Chloroflexota bacterium]